MSKEEIEDLLQGRPPSTMFNSRSPSFSKIGIAQNKLTDGNLLELMLKEPRLIRRPIVRIGKNVYFGASSKFLADVFKP